jgi:hypothetical protein
MFVLDCPFALRQEYKRKDRARRIQQRRHGVRALEPMRERDRKRCASVQRIRYTGGGDCG